MFLSPIVPPPNDCLEPPHASLFLSKSPPRETGYKPHLSCKSSRFVLSPPRTILARMLPPARAVIPSEAFSRFSGTSKKNTGRSLFICGCRVSPAWFQGAQSIALSCPEKEAAGPQGAAVLRCCGASWAGTLHESPTGMQREQGCGACC